MSDTLGAVIDLDHGLLSIPDHDGRVIDYLIERDPDAEGWGVILRRIDCEAGPYKVSKPPRRLWACDCPDAKYRAKREARSCKHVTACRGVYALVARLSIPVTPEAQESNP